MKRDKWRTPASPRRNGALTMRGCGKVVEQLGGIAPTATSRSTRTSHAKVANDTKLSPIPRLNFNLRRMRQWRKFDQIP